MAQGANYTVIQSPVDPRVHQAEADIFSSYGVNVSVAEKKKTLLKFGRSASAGTTSSTVWAYAGTLANETYISSNLIDKISSSNAGDNQSVTIEGHTISGTDLTFVVQTATLNGQNKVTLTTPLARSTRMYNTGTTNFAGTVYVYEDSTISAGVPSTPAKVHLNAPTTNLSNSSQKCATSISSSDFWLITEVTVAVLKKTAGFADFSLQVREVGSVFRTVDIMSASNSSGTIVRTYDPFIIAPANSDVRMICTADASSTAVMATIGGVLAVVV